MKPKADTILWQLADNLRSSLAGSEQRSAIAQLCVISELARRDAGMMAVVRDQESSSTFIKDILDTATRSLKEVAEDDPSYLLDPTDKCWSDLSTSWVLESLRNLLLDVSDDVQRQRAQMLLRWPEEKGRSVTPMEIVLAMRAFLGEPSVIALPFDGSALTVLEATSPDQRVTIVTEMMSTFRLLRQALFVANRTAQVSLNNPYDSYKSPAKAATLLIPPFGVPSTARAIAKSDAIRALGKLSSEELATMIVASAKTGPIVALVPAGTLFRGGSSSRFRRWLVEQGRVTTVVEFPQRMLENTSIGSALLVIDPTQDSNETVRLVSADSDRYLNEGRIGRFLLTGWKKLVADVAKKKPGKHIVDVTLPDLADNEYILQPSRYLGAQESGLSWLLKDRQTVPLSATVEIRRPIALKNSTAKNAASYSEVLMSDFGKDWLIRNGSKKRLLDEKNLTKAQRQVLRAGDILLGVKGTIGKVAMVSEDASPNLLAGQTTVILRLKNGLVQDPVYLLRFLTQPEVRETLESLAGGTTISFLRAKDLEELPVPIPTVTEQDRIRSIHNKIVLKFKASSDLAAEAIELSSTAFPMVSSQGEAKRK